MKLKNKPVLLIVFTLGALLFATSALADIAHKDGYEQLKDGIKLTAASCSSQLDSFTMEMNFALKQNGQLLSADSETKKYDKIRQAVESISSQENPYSEPTPSYYYYSDPTTDIRYYPHRDDTYYVTEYNKSRDNPATFDNPFEEEVAVDVERIFDALIGSLRDHVVVTENADGSKEFSGSLSEVQIPALINALVSLEMKQQFRGQPYGQGGQMPDLAQDVYVKEINGSALINADGLLERILGTAVISGQDNQGITHELTVDILLELKDINNTTVVKPDLSGKNVVTEQGQTGSDKWDIANPQKFIGLYKNDIIIEEEGKFVKIGERHLEIVHIDQSSIAGRYEEHYKPGYERYADHKLDFTFEAKLENNHRDAQFTYTSSSGTKGNGSIYLDDYAAKINFWLNDLPFTSGTEKYDSVFNPVLD
ncbi:MAG: hypothetical protein GX207_05820 [Peptococcaceae bacterium]|nr:hypothetical protein [Peptococcaceae bacterium]